jgi:hypothetical protein
MFLLSSGDNSGHVRKSLLLILLLKVDGSGLLHHVRFVLVPFLFYSTAPTVVFK